MRLRGDFLSMPETITKDPQKVQAGLIGARRRWGGQRILRLDELTPSQRTLVLALVVAAKSIEPNEKAPAASRQTGAQEVDDVHGITTAAS